MSSTQKPDQENFLILAETASCLILVLREDGAIAYANSFAEGAGGYGKGELAGRDYQEILQCDGDLDRLESEFKGAFQADSENEAKWEADLRGRNGNRCPLAWSTRRVDDFEGRPGLLLVAHGTVDQQPADEDLRSQAACLRAVLDTAVDGIITTDERGLVQSANSAVVDIFGFSANELIGQNISVLMPSPFREEHSSYMKNYLRAGRRKVIGIGREVEGRRKDGTIFPCYISVSEVPLPDRRLFTGILRDITQPKRAEERALQAERLAAIGQTAAGLAHESRNAFQRSHACLEMLTLELEGRPSELELVERTQRALDHVHKLYEEVRDYAAPIILDRHMCDLSHLWRDAWSHLDIIRGDQRIKLVESIDVGNPSCEVDWFAIGQVFRNILENAISVCADQGSIEVRCVEHELNGCDALRISIRDDGPGIASDICGDVFEAFFTTKTKGTGLGMAIAKRIVEAHDGTIELGDHGAGAEFIVTLPRA